MAPERGTIQKKLIKEAVTACKKHSTADELYNYLKLDNPNISKATVYRNLNQMAISGEILKVEIPNAPDRYDFLCSPHYHIHCTGCGEVFDAQIDYMPHLNCEPQSGFEISGHIIVFKGLCPECKSLVKSKGTYLNLLEGALADTR